MSTFAKGKYAQSISDRSGQAFPYREMVTEWNGSRVHISEYEKKHPQLERKAHRADPQGLQNARPARTEPAVDRILTLNPMTITTGANSTSVVSAMSANGFNSAIVDDVDGAAFSTPLTANSTVYGAGIGTSVTSTESTVVIYYTVSDNGRAGETGPA